MPRHWSDEAWLTVCLAFHMAVCSECMQVCKGWLLTIVALQLPVTEGYKMACMQGGEAKVMALVEEVQERTAELLEVKRQVAEAESLHEHLRAQLAAREKGTVAVGPKAVEANAIETTAVEATV